MRRNRIPCYTMGLYEITVFEINGTQRTRLSAMEVQATDAKHALERASIWVKSNRALEIREVNRAEIPIERPPVTHISREGI